MKGWREHAAYVLQKHGAIAAKMKSALGPGPSGFWEFSRRLSGNDFENMRRQLEAANAFSDDDSEILRF